MPPMSPSSVPSLLVAFARSVVPSAEPERRGAAILAAICLSVSLWDYFTQIFRELAFYRSNKEVALWRNPMTWLLIVLRYSPFLAVFPMVLVTSVEIKNCQLALSLSQIGAILASLSTGIILIVRVFSVRGGSKMLHGLLGMLLAIAIVCWIASATQYKSYSGEPTTVFSTCRIEPLPSWALINFVAMLLFNIVVLAFTASRFTRDIGATKSRTAQRLHKLNFGLVTFLTWTTLGTLLVRIAGRNNPRVASYDALMTPLLTFATVATGSRVFFNLRAYEKRRADYATGNFMLSTGFTTKFFAPQKSTFCTDEGTYGRVGTDHDIMSRSGVTATVDVDDSVLKR